MKNVEFKYLFEHIYLRTCILQFTVHHFYFKQNNVSHFIVNSIQRLKLNDLIYLLIDKSQPKEYLQIIDEKILA